MSKKKPPIDNFALFRLFVLLERLEDGRKVDEDTLHSVLPDLRKLLEAAIPEKEGAWPRIMRRCVGVLKYRAEGMLLEKAVQKVADDEGQKFGTIEKEYKKYRRHFLPLYERHMRRTGG